MITFETCSLVPSRSHLRDLGQYPRADHCSCRKRRGPRAARCGTQRSGEEIHKAAMSENLFSENFQQTPYWWDDVPRRSAPETALPPEVDVAVVGSGYT